MHSVGNFTNISVRYNYFKNFASTGGLIFTGGSRVYIYGNVFHERTGTGGNGVISNWTNAEHKPDMTTENLYIYNNIFVGTNAGIGWSTAQNWQVLNNLFVNCNPVKFHNTAHDHSASDINLSEANGQIGLTSDIFSNYAGHNFSLRYATNSGLNLPSPFNADMYGLTCGADGIWDIGAYEFDSETSLDPILGDLNSDGVVNIFDYNIFLQNFGQTDCGNVADLDDDCAVDIFDYNIFLRNFGTTSQS